MKTACCILLLFFGEMVAAPQANLPDPQAQFEQALLEQYNTWNLHYFVPDAGSRHQALVRQSGQQHSAHLQQIGEHALAIVLQQGAGHTAAMQLHGAQLEAQVIQQGANHTYQLDCTGEQSLIQVYQQGQGHTLEQDLAVRNSRFLVIQQGANNTIQQHEDRPGSMQLWIRQQGEGMHLIIRNGQIR